MRFTPVGFFSIIALLLFADFLLEQNRNNNFQISFLLNLGYQYPGMDATTRPGQTRENAPPTVTILSPEPDESINWDTQVRYEIRVSDEEDGESRYGEINPDEVILEVEYLSYTTDPAEKEKIKGLRAKNEHPGLSLIRTSTCFDCHRGDTRLVGPSFSEIAQRYKADAATIEKLGTRIIEGSSGNWGDAVMPANNSLTHKEAMEIVSYVLNQGVDKSYRVYPGLAGIIRTIKKPPGESRRMVLLTASYLDHGIKGETRSRKRGTSSIVLNIR